MSRRADADQTRLNRIVAFLRRQKHNYRVAVVRASANRFLLSLTQQYSSIYTVALGADSVQLGMVNSIGSAISSLISMPVGWGIDRYGIRRLYLLGIALLAGDALIYGLARGWQTIIVATVLASVAMRLTGTGCSVICADSVHNEDRVTAQNVCVTFSSVSSMMSPLIAAYLVTSCGGINVEGIRPLYYLRFVGYGLVFLFVALYLREPQGGALRRDGGRLSFAVAYRQLFEGRKGLPRWILIASLTGLPMAMTTPFLQLFAHEIKGADQYVLGAMATAMVVTRLLFGVPLGRLADSIGRKRTIYLITPLWYASFLMLILATGPVMLVLAGALQTFYFISSGATSAMTIELVPVDCQGRWSGLLGLCAGLVAVPAPMLGGLLWRELGPIYVFLLPLAIDLLLRIPLLSSVPETLQAQSHGTACA